MDERTFTLRSYYHEIAGNVNLVAYEDRDALIEAGIAYYLSGVGTVVHHSIVAQLGMTFTLSQAIEMGQIIREQLERREANRAASMVRCSCGHLSAHPMSTARGSACEDCYDRMSL